MKQTISPYGIKQGAFIVDQNGGATYNIPLRLPPGINNMQPQLSLTYNHRNGNGVCGVGFSLSGLSAITRVNATMAVDGFRGGVNYNDNDRLAVDGQRLINMEGEYWDPGAVFYTENHNWNKVVRGSDPGDGFTVYARNGEVWRYGATPDSRIFGKGSQNIRVWALSEMEDMNGNKVEYHYTLDPDTGADNGAFYISEIRYTSRADFEPRFSVNFNYSKRDDEIVSYLGGYEIRTGYLMTGITIMMAGNIAIRNYELCYALSAATFLSRLTTINVSGADGNLLPTIVPEWTDVAQPTFDTSQPTSKLLGAPGVIQTSPLDINGDGLTDIVQFYRDENYNIYAVSYYAGIVNGAITYATGDSNGQLLGAYKRQNIFVADINGDGLTDIIVCYPGGPGNRYLYIDAFINNGTSFGPAITTKTNHEWLNKSLGFFPIDADGDGRIDLVQVFNDTRGLLNMNVYLAQFAGNQGSFVAAASVNTGVAYSPKQVWPIDVNGDGMVDLVALWVDENELLNTTSFITGQSVSGISFFSTKVDTNLGNSNRGTASILPADVNGDGIMDILQITRDDGEMHFQSYYSNAIGGFVPGPETVFQNQKYSSDQLTPLSVNGTGQTNIVANWLDTDHNWNYIIFSATSVGQFNSITATQTTTRFDKLNFFTGDANGLGKAGLFNCYVDNYDRSMYVQPFPSTGVYPDLVSTITDQLGGEVSITYAPLTDPGVYTFARAANQYPATGALLSPCLQSPAQFPIQSVLGKPIYVVSSYTFSNNVSLSRFGYAHRFGMHYCNGRFDLTGRGWQGFSKVTATDMNTGLVATKSYLQDFPYTGTVVSSSKSADPSISNDPRVRPGKSNLLALTLHTCKAIEHAGRQSTAAFEVLNTGSLSYRYNYGDDHFDYLTGKSYDYDSYANRTSKTWWGYISFIDPASIVCTNPFPAVAPIAVNEVVYTLRTYQNTVDDNKWALGLLLSEKLTSVPGNTLIQFQNGDFKLLTRTYDSNTFNVLCQQQWDNQNQVMLTTSFTYDRFGNRITETKPGNVTTTYTYETVYNTYVDTIQSPPNNSGFSLCSYHGFDPRFGIQVALKDANDCIRISGVDGFGRCVSKQGPVPDGCKQQDVNQCPGFVTGIAGFTTATVLTLETFDYLNDSFGGIYVSHKHLAEFPSGSDRVFDNVLKFCDGLARNAETATLSKPSLFAISKTFYLANGKPAAHSLPVFGNDLVNPPADYRIEYTYDVLGRRLTQVKPAGSDNRDLITSTWYYDAGEQVTYTQAAGMTEQYQQVITSHSFNGKDQKVKLVLPGDNNAATVFEYDPIGRMTKVTDSQNITNTLTYDSLNRKLTYDNPDQNTLGPSVNALEYLYDAATGNVAKITNAAGETTAYAYDKLGRMVLQSFSDGRQYALTYDSAANGIGRMGTVSISNGSSMESSTNYEYDIYGNVTTEQLTFPGKSYTTKTGFDPLSRLISRTYDDMTVLVKTYQFGVPGSVVLDGVTIDYPLDNYTPLDAAGKARYLVDNNLVLETGYTFNVAGTLYEEAATDANGTGKLSFAYSYDHLEQLTGSTDAVGSTNELFEYLERKLVSISSANEGFPNNKFEYDDAGRITSANGNTYTYEGSHAPKEIEGGLAYSALHDSNGRVSTRTINGATWIFGYDIPGNLVTVQQNGAYIRRTLYSEKGARIRETESDGTVTTYVCPGYLETVDTQGNVTITKHLMDRTGAVARIITKNKDRSLFLLRHDHKGNVTHVFSESCALVSRIVYDGLGRPSKIGGDSASYDGPQYESRRFDSETGLYYFGARYYDPYSGTFLTPDTRTGARSKLRPVAWNRFAFELNNPVNNMDPDGHFSLAAKIGIGIGLAVLTAVGVALSIFTGGASGAVVGMIDGAAAAAETTVGTTVMTTVETTVEASAETTTELAETTVSTVSETVPETVSENGLEGLTEEAETAGVKSISTAARLARIGVYAVGGAVSGAVSGTGISGITYLSGGNTNSSGLLAAMEKGALSGAVSGAITGALAPEIDTLVTAVGDRILYNSLANAVGNVAGTIAADEAVDHQFPDFSKLYTTAVSGLVVGALMNMDTAKFVKESAIFNQLKRSLMPGDGL